ncbi:MAG: FAD:protein FMN transferase [Clostridiales bacterium]|nr:FAD:protein FMN transferase [Clostridiales bacterium]
MNQTKQKPFSLPHILLLILLLLVIGAIIWLFAGQKKGNPAYESTSLVMGTYMQQTIYGSGGEEAAAAASQAVANLENRISWRKEDSDIAKLNANAGKDWITVDDSTLSMLEQCLDVAEQSNGAYDPTILPLSSLWDFGGENQHLPDRDEVERFASYVDYQILRIDMEQKEASLKNSLYALDLGGAGKGAACDAAVQSYGQSGVSCAIVAVGGSVGVYGQKPDRTDWRVAIRNPFQNLEEQQNASMGTLDIHSGFVSTSGLYEKYFEQDGKLYHHILDPGTGYPVDNDLVSVTVVCDSGALSDMLSTACFVLGWEGSQELLTHYNAGAVFIYKNKDVAVTENLKDRLTITAGDYALLSKTDKDSSVDKS